MDYCPKCLRSWDKKYNKCPFCGYEDNTNPTQGSVFDILDDMAYFSDGIEYVYPEEENRPFDAYSTEDEKSVHLCQNDVIEGSEEFDLEFDKEHFKAFPSSEADPYSRKDIVEQKTPAHICQNDILTGNGGMSLPGDKKEKQQTLTEIGKAPEEKNRALGTAYSKTSSGKSSAAAAMAKNNRIKIKKAADNKVYIYTSGHNNTRAYSNTTPSVSGKTVNNPYNLNLILFTVSLTMFKVNPVFSLAISLILLMGKNKKYKILSAIVIVLSIIEIITSIINFL